MEQTPNQRIKKYIETKKITQESFRASIGVAKKQQVSLWLTDNGHIPEKYLIEILRQYSDINPRWLFFGEGDMYEDKGYKHESELQAVNENKIGYECGNCKLLNAHIERQEKLIDHLEKQLSRDLQRKAN